MNKEFLEYTKELLSTNIAEFNEETGANITGDAIYVDATDEEPAYIELFVTGQDVSDADVQRSAIEILEGVARQVEEELSLIIDNDFAEDIDPETDTYKYSLRLIESLSNEIEEGFAENVKRFANSFFAGRRGYSSNEITHKAGVVTVIANITAAAEHTAKGAIREFEYVIANTISGAKITNMRIKPKFDYYQLVVTVENTAKPEPTSAKNVLRLTRPYKAENAGPETVTAYKASGPNLNSLVKLANDVINEKRLAVAKEVARLKQDGVSKLDVISRMSNKYYSIYKNNGLGSIPSEYKILIEKGVMQPTFETANSFDAFVGSVYDAADPQ